MKHNLNEMANNYPSSRRILTGMFRDSESIMTVYNKLHEKGYSIDEINLIMTNETHKLHFSGELIETEIETKAAEGVSYGSTIGGPVGAFSGAVAALGTSLAAPDLKLKAVGPIAAGITGEDAGANSSGLTVAFVGSGIPEARAQFYESGIRNGKILLGVRPRTPEDATFFINNWRINKVEGINSF